MTEPATPILVTGATGFIGSHLVPRLRADAVEVRVLVRPGRDAAALERAGVEVVRGDVADWDSLVTAVDGCGGVVHLANLYSFWEPDPSRYRHVNVEGTRRVALAAAEAGVDLFLHVSSVVAFGRPAEVPFREDSAPGPVRFSAYAESKYQADRVVEAIAQSRDLPLAILYPASVVGAGDPKSSGRYVADIARRRLPAAVFPDCVMTWVHVRDVAEAIARLLARGDAAGARYIVGRHRATLHQVNRLIGDIASVAPPRPDLPDGLARLSATLFTAAACVTGRPPPWGLSRDLARTLSHSIQADGSRIARDLGLRYTDLRTGLSDTLSSLPGRDS